LFGTASTQPPALLRDFKAAKEGSKVKKAASIVIAITNTVCNAVTYLKT
jgi:hypothetical protein